MQGIGKKNTGEKVKTQFNSDFLVFASFREEKNNLRKKRKKRKKSLLHTYILLNRDWIK